MIAPTTPVDISMNIGTTMMNRPISDTHHIGFRPTRSDRCPANGTNTIIASMPMIGTTSDMSVDSPMPCSR